MAGEKSAKSPASLLPCCFGAKKSRPSVEMQPLDNKPPPAPNGAHGAHLVGQEDTVVPSEVDVGKSGMKEDPVQSGTDHKVQAVTPGAHVAGTSARSMTSDARVTVNSVQAAGNGTHAGTNGPHAATTGALASSSYSGVPGADADAEAPNADMDGPAEGDCVETVAIAVHRRTPASVPRAMAADVKLTLAMYSKAISGIGAQLLLLANEWNSGTYERVYTYEKMLEVPEPPGRPLLPRHVRSLPKAEAFSSEKIGALVTRAHVFLRSQMPLLARLDDGPQAFADVGYDIFKAFFGDEELFPMPRGVLKEEQDFWQDDECFTDQFLNGCNPTIIVKASSVEQAHQSMPVELHKVRDGERGRSVEQLVTAGDLFWADYRVLSGSKMFEEHEGKTGPFINRIRFDAVDKEGEEPAMKKYFYAPFVAFYKKSTGRLGVLGIVLVPKSGVVYNGETCATTPNVYTFAKMHVACADNQMHQFYSHLGRCHLVFEPFGVAVRNVFANGDATAQKHVVGRLLRPHFHDHMAINWLARNTLIAKGNDAIAFTDAGFALGTKGGVSLLATKYAGWKLQDQAFPAQLSGRGFDPNGDDGVDGYFYRDDGMRMWKALKRYVQGALQVYYGAEAAEAVDVDEKVRRDGVLGVWCREMRDEGKAYVPSFPGQFDTMEQLAETVTTIMYNVSAEHAAVNASQERYLAYVPNRPNALFRAVPMPGGQDMSLRREVLGIHRMGGNELGVNLPLSFAMFQVQFSQLLTMPATRTLVQLEGLGEGYEKVHEQLMNDFERAHYSIKARNMDIVDKWSNRAPYEFLDPAQVAVSIEI